MDPTIARDILIGIVASTAFEVIRWVIKSKRRQAANAVRAAATHTRQYLDSNWRRVIRFICTGLCFWQIAAMLDDPSPLTRLDVALISFWMFWACFAAVTATWGWHSDEE